MARQSKSTARTRSPVSHKTPAQQETGQGDSSSWFRIIAELTPDAVMIFDQHGTVHYWNHAAEQMFGYSREEMSGSSAFVIVPERYREKNHAGLQKVLASNLSHQQTLMFETPSLRKDGTEIFVQYSTAVWKQGDTVFFGSVVRDISRQHHEAELSALSQQKLEELIRERTQELLRTNILLEQEMQERHRAVELLRESEKRYRAVFENTGTAMIIFGDDMIITMANAEAEKLSGYSRAELEGKKSWAEFVYPEDLTQLQQFHQERMKGHDSAPRSCECRMVDRSGRMKNIFLSVTLIPGTQLRVASLVDITVLKQAEENLMRLTAIIESTNDLVATADKEFFLLYMNRAGRRMLGWDENASLQGKSIAEVHPKWAIEVIQKQGVPTALREGVWSGETAVVGPDGHEIPVSHVIMAHLSASGELQYFSSIIRNIAEIKNAQIALQESEERYRSVIETASDAIITVDACGTIVSWNQAAEKLYGYTKQEALGKPFTLIVPERFHALQQKLFTEKLKTAETFYLPPSEGIGRRRDGTEFPVETSIAVWEVGGSRFFTAINRDITKRKRAEQELKRLMTAIEQASENIVIMEPDGTLVYANPAVERFSGYRREEIIGHNSFHPATSTYEQSFFDAVSEMLRQGKTWNGRVQFRKKDGTFAEIEQSIAPIVDSSGRVINLLSIARDISREVALERQLRQSQKMEAIGTLAGGIAHDFNNILAAIMGYTELSLSEVPEDGPVGRNLALILKSSLRARDLVRQILAFSRKSQEERHPVCFQEIVHEALKLLRASIPTTIAINEQCTAPGCMVLANPTQLHQILINLCTNAAQAMQEHGGTITISLTQVELTPDEAAQYADLAPGRYVQLEVCDTGPGIDPKIMDRIFDPFFTTKEVGKGTGMGLAVVLGIVKSYQGTITAHNMPDGGACFTVLLPCLQEAAPQPRTEPAELPRGTERILFIDDEALIVEIGTEMLRALGYAVTGVQRSTDGWELFRQNPHAFDLIITDQTMPDMTGFSLAKQCLQLRPDIPIILCTGYSETVSEDQARAAGIRGVLVKPVKLQEFAESVRAALASTPPRS